MYRLSVMGHTPEELRKNVIDLAKSYGAETVTTVSTGYASTLSDDDREEVNSPYSATVTTEEEEEVEDESLDIEGLPWDERIHASSKAKTNKGYWKARKNVDPATVAKVKAELLNGSSSTSTNGGSIPQQHAPAPVQQPVHVAPVINIPTPAPVMPQIQGGHTLVTFCANFPTIVATLITEKKIDQAYVNQWNEYFEVKEIWNIRDDQKAVMFDQFVQHGYVTKVG